MERVKYSNVNSFDSDYKGLAHSQFNKEFNIRFNSGEAFFFLVDYEKKFFDVIDRDNFLINNISLTLPTDPISPRPPLFEEIIFEKSPPSFLEYADQFHRVMKEIQDGNTYLLNLTTETPIHTNLSLKQIYTLSQAPYRLHYRNQFVSFSPETFVKIKDGIIQCFPMKGTYVDLGQAQRSSQKLNSKELSEQTTVVDRVRNDLSQICDRVWVEDFLSVQEVETYQGKLYQTTSRVMGELGEGFFHNPSGSLLELLPAASVTGAPKDSTMAIIQQVERHHRHFYTGIWGLCWEGNIDSTVIIRYIEKRNRQLYYKSGGGITFLSDVNKEYQEMIDKIYLPFPSPHYIG